MQPYLEYLFFYFKSLRVVTKTYSWVEAVLHFCVGVEPDLCVLLTFLDDNFLVPECTLCGTHTDTSLYVLYIVATIAFRLLWVQLVRKILQ